MDQCDVVIIGGGPAGSSCAWKLRSSGLDIMMLDKQKFPRSKPCAGWISPQVVEELKLDLEAYAKGRVLQPVTRFRTGGMEPGGLDSWYEQPMGWGVRRSEFDQYLVERSGVWLLDGEEVTSLERDDSGWIVNKALKTKLVIGAGGHHCPAARMLGSQPDREPIAATQQAEFLLDVNRIEECQILPGTFELYVCEDLNGFGWCFRKGDYLNIGLGRRDRVVFSSHCDAFLELLQKTGRIIPGSEVDFEGHAYLLQGKASRKAVADGVMLLGDAAAMALSPSGEGIRSAVLSGLAAGEAVMAARGDYSRARLQGAMDGLEARLVPQEPDWILKLARKAPAWLKRAAAPRMLSSDWFGRRRLLERWFLCGMEHSSPQCEMSQQGASPGRVKPGAVSCS